MNILFLSGMSPRNQTWIYKVNEAVGPLFDQRVVQEYAHWSKPDQAMDIPGELAAAERAAAGLGEYVIFAKSVGTALSLQGLHAGTFKPRGCVLAGLPLALFDELKIDARAWLDASNVPVVIVQNTDDPVGSFAAVQARLQPLPPNCQLVELPGATHDYDDLAKLRELTTSLL